MKKCRNVLLDPVDYSGCLAKGYFLYGCPACIRYRGYSRHPDHTRHRKGTYQCRYSEVTSIQYVCEGCVKFRPRNHHDHDERFCTRKPKAKASTSDNTRVAKSWYRRNNRPDYYTDQRHYYYDWPTVTDDNGDDRPPGVPQGSTESPVIHHILNSGVPCGNDARGSQEFLVYADDTSECSKGTYPGVKIPGAVSKSK